MIFYISLRRQGEAELRGYNEENKDRRVVGWWKEEEYVYWLIYSPLQLHISSSIG